MEVLYPGCRGKTVVLLQQLLQHIGYEITPSGIFCEHTLQNVVAFQNAMGINPDGIVGDYTWTYLVQMRSVKDASDDTGHSIHPGQTNNADSCQEPPLPEFGKNSFKGYPEDLG